MKILLVQNSLYYPAYGGGNKSNRLLLEALAARGHPCRVITRLGETAEAERFRLFLADLASRGVAIESTAGGVVVFHLNGVEVHTETSVPKAREHLVRQIEQFAPDWTLVSTDDPFQLFLGPALQAASGRVVFLARTTLSLPFGPDTAITHDRRTAALARVAGIVAVSDYVVNYIRQWGGLDAVNLPISLHAPGPHPNLGNSASGYITMVNPCAIKGISIFLELARCLPALEFAAVPMWGTNEQDLELLENTPNISLLPPVEKIDQVFVRTRVLLVPSLCHDAKPRIVLEAMSRGIPVLASDVGGVAEAKLGVDYLLPVRPIQRYRAQMDAQMVPRAAIPKQEVGPWLHALERLVRDPAHYEQISTASHAAASAFLSTQGIEPFENYLMQLNDMVRSAAAPQDSALPSTLSPDKRKLLAMRLRERRK